MDAANEPARSMGRPQALPPRELPKNGRSGWISSCACTMCHQSGKENFDATNDSTKSVRQRALLPVRQQNGKPSKKNGRNQGAISRLTRNRSVCRPEALPQRCHYEISQRRKIGMNHRSRVHRVPSTLYHDSPWPIMVNKLKV
jgi:hypothetical protein